VTGCRKSSSPPSWCRASRRNE